jgi:hypothetical protein
LQGRHELTRASVARAGCETRRGQRRIVREERDELSAENERGLRRELPEAASFRTVAALRTRSANPGEPY